MTKTANKKAIKALPALRKSLLWYKRETLRSLKSKAQSASGAFRAFYFTKIGKVRTTDLADLRGEYLSVRCGEIRRYRRAELATAVPGIVWSVGGAS